MGASTSTEHKVPNEQREAEALAASTGALPMLQKSFSNLADPQSNAIPLHSLQQCFRLTYKNPVACEAIPMPDSFPALLDHLGGSISDLFFVSDKGGVNWVELVRGYNKCCARMSASVSLNKLLRVFSVTLRKAGSPSNLEFESDDADCKITGSLMPADVLMLLWMCWAMSWYSRTSKISNEKLHLRLPDVKHVVLSAIVSCAEAGSGLNVWDCDFSGLGVQLPVGKFQSWVLKTVPGLPDCFTQFAKIRIIIVTSSSPLCSNRDEITNPQLSARQPPIFLRTQIGIRVPNSRWLDSVNSGAKLELGFVSVELGQVCGGLDENWD